MNDKAEMMNMVENLPKGISSQTGRYFCETCKKLFLLEEPVCPYMTKMCLNSPIPVEKIAPPTPEAFEKLGLFYPKIPQRIIDSLIKEANTEKLGEKFAELYIKEMEEWNIQCKTDPLYFLKTFIVFVAGSETAQRVLQNKVLFLVMDINRVYKNGEIKEIIQSGVNYLVKKIEFPETVEIKFVKVVPGKMGKYYCKMCKMFFEFGVERDKVTCPLMAQKCMFEPKSVDKENGTVEDLVKIYKITPHLYKKLIMQLPVDTKTFDVLFNVVSTFVKNVDISEVKKLGGELGIE